MQPLADPALRALLLGLKQQKELVIDTVTQDRVLEAGFSEAARERAKGIVQTFETFIAQHKDEITALQILYSRPIKAPLTFEDIKALADALHAPPHLLEGTLWQAYAALDKSKVKGTSRQRILTDLVSLVRFAMQQDNELVPYPERVAANFKAWLAQQSSPPLPLGEGRGEGQPQHRFTQEQLHWLEMIRDTSRPAWASRSTTSICRHSASMVGWGECINSSGQSCRHSWSRSTVTSRHKLAPTQ